VELSGEDAMRQATLKGFGWWMWDSVFYMYVSQGGLRGNCLMDSPCEESTKIMIED
jgi:hypothetical protein